MLLIYCADVVVLNWSHVKKCQSHSNATDCHSIITLLFQYPQGKQGRMRLCWLSHVKWSLKHITHSSQSADPQHRHCLSAQGFHPEYLHWYLNHLIMLPCFFALKFCHGKLSEGDYSFWYESVGVYTSPEYILDYFCLLKKFQQGPL